MLFFRYFFTLKARFFKAFPGNFVKMVTMQKAMVDDKISDNTHGIKTLNADAIVGLDARCLLEMLTEKEQINERKSEVIEAQKRRIKLLEEYLRLEKHRRFGPSSENSTNQMEWVRLFFNDILSGHEQFWGFILSGMIALPFFFFVEFPILFKITT